MKAAPEKGPVFNGQVFDDHVHMMEVMGGSFVSALADCFYRADSQNKARLVAAFPEYFGRYKKMFEDYRAAQGKEPA